MCLWEGLELKSFGKTVNIFANNFFITFVKVLFLSLTSLDSSLFWIYMCSLLNSEPRYSNLRLEGSIWLWHLFKIWNFWRSVTMYLGSVFQLRKFEVVLIFRFCDVLCQTVQWDKRFNVCKYLFAYGEF